MAEAIPLLVVARWFPAHDEPARGAFVAHQVEALHELGLATPTVLAFEDVRLAGSPEKQELEAAAVLHLGTTPAADTGWVVSPRAANGPDGIPVLRVRVPHPSAAARAPDDEGLWHARAAIAAASGWPTGNPSLSRGVVHAHEAFPDGMAGVELAGLTGRPLVVTEHASYVGELLTWPETRARYLAVVERAARYLVVSETLAARIRRLAPELGDRITIMPNAIPTDRFALADPAARDPDELLFVGARKIEKGIDRLLEAFAIVHRERPATRLRLVGTAPKGDDGWRSMADDLGVGGAVTFDGPTTPDAIAVAMGRAGLFVHPSPSETFGVVAAEALATGLPVVAIDSGGVTEIVGQGEGPLGTTIAWDGPESLGRAILAALDRRATFDPEALRASVVERYDATIVAHRLADLYAEVRDGFGYPVTGAEPPRPRPGPEPRPVMLGLDRRRLLERRAALPGPAPTAITTTEAGASATGQAQLEAGSDGVWSLDPGAALRRHRTRLQRNPLIRFIEPVRHGRGAAADRRHEADIRAAVAGQVARVGEIEAVDLVMPVDGNDARIVAGGPLGPRLRPAPGGLRWLADQRLADQPPADRHLAGASGAAEPPAADEGDLD